MGNPEVVASLGAVLVSLVLLSPKCNGARPSDLRSLEAGCPHWAIRRCRTHADCEDRGQCAQMNGTLSVCASASSRTRTGVRDPSFEWRRCQRDEDCGRLKCCPSSAPPLSSPRLTGVCVAEGPLRLPATPAAEVHPPQKRPKRCSHGHHRSRVFGPPSLPTGPFPGSLPPFGPAPPPSLPHHPMFPRPPYVMPPPTFPRHPLQPWVPIPPPPPTFPRAPSPPWVPPPPTQPRYEQVCPPTITAAFRVTQCHRDSDCGHRRGDKCCPTSTGGRMCIPPVSAPWTPNIRKWGRCPAGGGGGSWVCSSTCSSDRDCPGARKCCSGRCPRSLVCMDPLF